MKETRKITTVTFFVIALVLWVPATAWSKDLDPKDFPVAVTVTEVSSQQLPTGTRTQVFDPCIGMGVNDPRRARVDCTPKSSNTSIIGGVVFTITASVKDKVYDLRGPRLELGQYNARFDKGHVEILAKNEKGKWVKVKYKIVGERKATP